MNKKTIITALLAAIWGLTSCSSDNEQGKPYTTDPVENAIFTDADIEWFNPKPETADE